MQDVGDREGTGAGDADPALAAPDGTLGQGGDQVDESFGFLHPLLVVGPIILGEFTQAATVHGHPGGGVAGERGG
ncbi:hypothetical protein [Micromonospora sonneratiae]|uniref:Uncharacterized protein n=1 Tax=Micromonospora sonneratiae TaxID=1184706 RepID=A0ABW3YAU9_9ACTN